MGSTRVGRVAVMSIHPTYARGILDGTKRVEFRKQRIADDVTHVIVYATAPVSAIIGAFTVESQHTLSPAGLWSRFRGVAGIGRKDFMAYFGDRRHGTGITVGEVLRSETPLGLKKHLGISRPPQSFQYVSGEAGRNAITVMSRE